MGLFDALKKVRQIVTGKNPNQPSPGLNQKLLNTTKIPNSFTSADLFKAAQRAQQQATRGTTQLRNFSTPDVWSYTPKGGNFTTSQLYNNPTPPSSVPPISQAQLAELLKKAQKVQPPNVNGVPVPGTPNIPGGRIPLPSPAAWSTLGRTLGVVGGTLGVLTQAPKAWDALQRIGTDLAGILTWGVGLIPGVNKNPAWLTVAEKIVDWRQAQLNEGTLVQPGGQITLQPPGPPPFTGGQTPGVTYKLRYQQWNNPSGNSTENPANYYLSPESTLDAVVAIGKVTSLYMTPGGGNSVKNVNFTTFFYVFWTDSGGNKNLSFRNSWGFKVNGWQRTDGQPDTGGDPPPTSPAVTTTYITNNYHNDHFYAPPTPEPEPSPPPKLPPPKLPLAPPATIDDLEINEGLTPEPWRIAEPPPITTDPEGRPERLGAPTNIPGGFPTRTNVRKKGGGVRLTPSTTTSETTELIPTEADSPETIPEKQFRTITPYLFPPIIAPPIISAPTSTPVNNGAKPGAEVAPEPPKQPPDQTPPPTGCDTCNRPIFQGQQNILDRLNAVGQGIDLSLLGVINNKLGDQVTGGISGWLQKAHRNLRIGRVLSMINTALLIHNAAMLSRNLTASVGDAISGMINNTINLIKNEDDSDINLNEIIGNTVENFLKSIIGADNYSDITETFKRYNRIINAAANIMSLIESSINGLAEGLELIGKYTGKVGNALKKSGTVLENSYAWMSETFQVRTGRIGALQRVVDGLESLENVASDLESATGEFREIQENFAEFEEQKQEIQSAIAAKETEKDTSESAGKTVSQPPDINLSDTVKPSIS